MRYQAYAEELTQLLDDDQTSWKSFWARNFHLQQTQEFKEQLTAVRRDQQQRSARMLAILSTIGTPSLSNIGLEAAQAISILALHDSRATIQTVHDAFVQCCDTNKQDTYYQAIPPLTDRLLILQRKPQVFGTQWDLDEHNYPFLPTVDNFTHVNERRAMYDLEPLRWPKSLAIPEYEQPWLRRPLTELIMRNITPREFTEKYQSYAN